MAVGTLTVDIVAKLAGIQGDLGKVSRLAEQSAKKIEKSFADAGKTVKDVFSALGASLTVGAAVQFVQQMVDAQDALVDLSKSTAISIETLSGLGFAAKTTGGDLDSIAASINKLQVNIGKDPEKYKQLGINAKDGYEAFKQLADIFVAIEEPEKRAAVAAEALGKSWAGAAPALSEGAKGFEALVSKGKDVSGVTAESAAKAAELNAKLDLLKARAGGAATELVNSLVPSLDRTAARMEALAAQGQGLQAVFAGLIGLAKLPFDLALGEIDTSRAGQIKDLENKLQSLETKAKRATGQGGFLGELVFGKPGEFDQQIAVTKNQIEALKKFSKDGAKAGDEAAKKPPSDAAIKQFVGGGGGGAKAGSRAGKAIDDGARLVEQLRDQIRATQDLTEVEKLELAIADGKYKTASAGNLALAMSYAETLDNIKATKKAVEEETDAHKKRLEVFAEGARVTESVRTPAEALNAELAHLLELLDAEAISMETFGRAASKAGDDMQRLESKTEETADTLTEFARSAAQNMQTAFADFLFDPFSDGTDSMLKKFGETIKRMIAEAASAEIMKRLFGDFGSKGGGGGQIGGWVGSILSSLPSFDVGTPYVPRDMVAKVHQGERIVPAAQNRAGGGGQSISVVINMAGGSSGSDLRQSAGDIARRIGQTVSGAARYA
jgi:hypothetical protein